MGGVRVDVNKELKFLRKFIKFTKKNRVGGVQVGGVRVLGGQGGQGGCERRIEVFVKIQKKMGGVGSGWGEVRVDVNEELEILGKFTKKNRGGGGGGVGSGVGLGGSGWM